MDKTDSELKKDVEAELAWDPAIQSTAIGVAVKNHIVTLSGHIDTLAEKQAILRALRRVTGVKAIALELDVRLSSDHRRSDTELANAAQTALAWNTVVPASKITLTVDKGWITLQGQVDWDYQRKSVESVLQTLKGVVGITNQVTLRPRVVPSDLQRRIVDALKRQVEREVERMAIQVDGSKVILRGKVNSWHERDAAQGVAWQAPGVTQVVNELVVG